MSLSLRVSLPLPFPHARTSACARGRKEEEDEREGGGEGGLEEDRKPQDVRVITSASLNELNEDEEWLKCSSRVFWPKHQAQDVRKKTGDTPKEMASALHLRTLVYKSVGHILGNTFKMRLCQVEAFSDTMSGYKRPRNLHIIHTSPAVT